MKRRGTAYVMVVGVAALASVAAIAGMLVLRAQRRLIELQASAGEARTIAMSAMERAAAIIEGDATWRSRGSGAWFTSAPLGAGTYSIEVTDPSDGDLADSEADPAAITVRATVGDATQIVTATLVPDRAAVESLAGAVFAAGDIDVPGGSIPANTDVRSNANVSATAGGVWPQVVASGTVSGGVYYGGWVMAAAPATGPSSSLIADYVARATEIPLNALAAGVLEKVVLSPDVNPFGAPAGGAGLYYIDCAGATIIVRNLRVLGTLILLDPGPGSQVRGSVRMDPVEVNYPALLVRGDIEIDTSALDLSELLLNVNFNPAGAPFTGSADADRLDSYPSRFTGIVYTTATTLVSGTARFSAPLQVGGRLTVSGAIESDYFAGAIGLPPPGFGGQLQMIVESPGVRRTVD
ncbi:MAG: hypothetical protein ACF8R7_09245 [Phycisphaerales bacterium JB039]